MFQNYVAVRSIFIYKWKNPNRESKLKRLATITQDILQCFSIVDLFSLVLRTLHNPCNTIAYCIASSYCVNLCCDTSTCRCIRHAGNTYDTINPSYVNSSLMGHVAFPPTGLEPFCCGQAALDCTVLHTVGLGAIEKMNAGRSLYCLIFMLKEE